MYEYIKGTVEEILAEGIVLENQGIGYFIYTPDSHYYKEKKQYKVYLYQNVKEDELTFYGFKTKEEKDFFLRLINVKGLGCKMALPFLAADVSSIVSAIEEGNITFLKKFPKIGDKIARQIILDLKGKLVSSEEEKEKRNEELMEALKALGYKASDIKKILPQIPKKESIEVQIKEGLRLLLK